MERLKHTNEEEELTEEQKELAVYNMEHTLCVCVDYHLN